MVHIWEKDNVLCSGPTEFEVLVRHKSEVSRRQSEKVLGGTWRLGRHQYMHEYGYLGRVCWAW